MKKILALILAVVMTLALCACGQTAAPATAEAPASAEEPAAEAPAADGKIKIGLAMHNQTADWAVQMKDSFLEAAAEKDDVEVIWNDANAVASAQVDNIETLVAQGCSVIVVDPQDYTALGNALKVATDAGVKIVNCDSKVIEDDQPMVSSFITADCYGGGVTLGEYLVDKIPEGAKVGYLNYSTISVIADRFVGVSDAFKAAGRDDIVVVEKECTDLNAIASYTEDMLLADPDITCFICLNDNTALSCWAACNQLGSPEILVYGFDGSPAGKQSISNGEMAGTMVYSPVDLAKSSFEAAYALATGGEAEKEVLVPMWLISPENISERNLDAWE